jgi:WD40 repeat protein
MKNKLYVLPIVLFMHTFSAQQPVISLQVAVMPTERQSISLFEKALPVTSVQHLVLGYLNKWNMDQTLTGHKTMITSLAISANSNMLFSVEKGAVLKSWVKCGNNTWKCMHTVQDQNAALCFDSLTSSSSGKLAFNADGIIRILNHAKTGWEYLCHTSEYEMYNHRVRKIKFSPNGQYLASSGDSLGFSQANIKIWQQDEHNKWVCVNTMYGHAGAITSLAFSPDGKYLASGSMDCDRTIKIWQQNNHNQWVCIQTLSSDWAEITPLIYDEQRKLHVTKRKKIRIAHNQIISALAFSPDRKYLASGSYDKTIKLWRQDSNQWIYLQTLMGHEGEVSSVAFSWDGTYLASGSADKTIKIWRQGNNNIWICVETLGDHLDVVHDIVLSPDGRYLASGSEDKTIKIWRNQALEILAKELRSLAIDFRSAIHV